MANFKGVQFDLQTVQAKDDANTNILVAGVVLGLPNHNNDTSQLSWNYNETTKVLYIYPSKMILQGRLIEVLNTQSFQFPLPNNNKFLGLNIDLNQTNTSSNVTQIIGDTFVAGNSETDNLLTTNKAFIPVFRQVDNSVGLYEFVFPGRTAIYSGNKLTIDSTNTPSGYTDIIFKGTHGRSYGVNVIVQSPNNSNGTAFYDGLVLNGHIVPSTRSIVVNFMDFVDDKNSTQFVGRSVKVEIIPSYTQSTDLFTLKTRVVSADSIGWSGKQNENATRYQYGNYKIGIELVPFTGVIM